MAAVTKRRPPARAPVLRKSAVRITAHARLFAQHVLPSGPEASTTVVRKNAEELSVAEQATFKSAVTKAIADGTYSRLVRIHADMSHDMHSMPGMPTGTQRFLPWHRLYLIVFERSLRVFEPAFFVPHWRWADASAIPAWLTTFRPNGVTDSNGNPIQIRRAPGTHPQARTLPSSQTIRSTVLNQEDYTAFTLALEGARPFGAHNLVHMWFNGTMSQIPTAPADPMFWMHHAEIDRIWAVWSSTHSGQTPNLQGPDAVLDPWPESYTDVLGTGVRDYHYKYDSMQM